MSGTLVPGQRVYFGRPHGEQTLGEVVRVNAASVKIKQLDERGATRVRPAGTIWRVHPSMVRPADGAPAGDPAPSPEKRPEAEVLKDVARCYSALSPENLSADGELPASAVRRRRSALNARLSALFRELGRRVTEGEAYAAAQRSVPPRERP